MTTGVIVVGGDYQGLGIVRSLGRRGVPVCVIDDQHSIARFARYTTHFVAVSRRAARVLISAILVEGLSAGRGVAFAAGYPRVPMVGGGPDRLAFEKGKLG